MGVVLLAHDPFIDRQVAIKTRLSSPIDKSEDLERHQQLFFNEARAAGKLIHPHIVSLYDAMWEDGINYLIMEHVEGATLKEYCRKDSLLSLEEVIKFVFQCAKALDYAHKNGVVHRDIKPSNIICTGEDIKISDFGIARVEGATDLDIPGTLTGSAFYVCPEQVRNHPLTPQSDLFSLGVVMYELLTGVKPFKAETDIATYYMIASQEADPLDKHRKDIPPALERVVRRALEKDPKKRYKTGMEMAADLSGSFDNLRFSDEEIDSKEQFNVLKKLSFFKDFSLTELSEVLKRAQWLKYQKNETIISEGEIENCFYIIILGEVMVKKEGRNLARLSQGDCFGEMAFLGMTTRTASIETLADSVLMKVNASLIERTSVSTQLRFYKVFADTLIKRLSRTSALLSKSPS